MIPDAFFVAAGGALGATARYTVGNVVVSETRARIPYSTLVVNVVGSFVLGIVVFGAGANDTLFLLAGVGACGAFTTFSSFSYETVEAFRDDAVAGAANATLNLALSLGALATAAYLVS